MAMYLTPAEFPAVRAAIDISLDASNLPDDVVALPMYAPEAERWVLAMNLVAAGYAPGSEAYLKTQVAAIFACAALVVPAVPNLTGEWWGNEARYTRKEFDPVALQATLWERARSALRSAAPLPVEAVGAAPRRFIFARAPACRYLP